MINMFQIRIAREAAYEARECVSEALARYEIGKIGRDELLDNISVRRQLWQQFLFLRGN